LETKTFKIATSELSAVIFSGIFENKDKKSFSYLSIVVYVMKVHLNFQIRDLTALHDLKVMLEPGLRVKLE